MLIRMYKTESSNNTIGKIKTDLIEKDIKFKDTANIRNPVIKLKLETVMLDYNYFEIPDFKRFYYVSDIYIESNDIIVFELKVDVLESFKDQILESHGLLKRSKNGNEYITDNRFRTEVKRESDIYYSDVTLEPVESIIMVVIN